MKVWIPFFLWEAWLLLLGLAGAVAYQMLTGKMNTGRMLFDKGTGNFSPGRVQLLLLTLMTAFYQLLLVLKDPTRLPQLPPEVLLVLLGGNLAYLGGKFYIFRREVRSAGQPTKKAGRRAR